MHRLRWEEDEIELLNTFIMYKWLYKDIAIELDRSEYSISKQASRLNIKSKNSNNKVITTEQYKTRLPKDIEVLEPYIDSRSKIMHKHSCGYIWDTTPCHIFSGHGCPKCAGNIKKTTKQYKDELPPDITVLDSYINSYTKILHKHSCGNIWSSTPHNILRGHSCPECYNTGFNDELPAVTYCVYFEDIDLYKVGISNNYINRLKRFGIKPEIIFTRKFSKGIEARILEKQWKENLKEYLVNTGLLKSGNTETFRI